MPSTRSLSGCRETRQHTGHPSQQSIAGERYALKPSRRNSVTSVTTSSPGSGAWKSWVPPSASGRLAGRSESSPA